MDIFKTTKKHLTIAGAIALVALIIVITLHIVSMQMDKNIEQLQDELVEVRGQDVATLKRAIRGYEENALILDLALIGRDEAILFIEDIQRLAQRSQLTSDVQTIQLFDITENNERIESRPGAITPERTHGELLMTLKTRGNWNNSMRFLTLLENIPHHLSIEDMRLVATSEKNAARSEWDAVFVVRVLTD